MHPMCQLNGKVQRLKCLGNYLGFMEKLHVTIKPLKSLDEIRQCVEIQKGTWGWSDEDILPLRTLLLIPKIGGQVLGAVDEMNLVLGFINAFPAFKNGNPFLHSQMLGVRKGFQRRGIGKMLKLAQRDDALQKGFCRIEWTFDPLEVQNAHFNLESLGVICRRYIKDAYGPSSSNIHGKIPTDRLVAEWYLNSNRVKNRLFGKEYIPNIPLTSIKVPVPPEIGLLKKKNAALSQTLQTDFRNLMISAFEKGNCITSFLSDLEHSTSVYHLVPFTENIIDI